MKKEDIKERPILFSTAMVQAILNGDKTETRRVINPQPDSFDQDDFGWVALYEGQGQAGTTLGKRPKYGLPGDLLWVRETFCKLEKDHIITTPYVYKANADGETEEIRREYIAAGRPYQWKPSIHMPKAAARIWLEIESITPWRLQSMSEQDARAEGAPRQAWKAVCTDQQGKSYKYGFINIWNSIHKDTFGPNGWNTNPWVWAVRFRVLSTTGRP